MKKIILMLMLIPNIAYASVVYTDFKEYIMGTEEVIDTSDLIRKEEYFVYNTYTEDKQEKYASLEEKLLDYQIDYDNFIIEKRNSLEKTNYSTSYEMKCLNENYSIGAFTLDNFSNDIKINELEIIFNSEVIPYGTRFTNFNGLSKYLFDNQIDNNVVTFKKETGILYLSFLKRTELNNISLKIHFPIQEIENIKFNFKISDRYEQEVSINLEKNKSNIVTLTFDNNYYNFLEENNFSKENKCILYYANEIPLYKHTKTNINVLNNYKELNNEDLFLLDDYKLKYNYFKRDKIELKDNIYLKDELLDINKYLKSTIPINELTIIDNIDYEKSGTYYLKIYYQEKLLIEQPIIYEKEIVEEINNNNKTNEIKEEKIITSSTKKYTAKKTTTKRIQTTPAKSIIIKNLNNNIKSTTKDNKNKLIIIIATLILLLTVFEIILLYVKRKYF